MKLKVDAKPKVGQLEFFTLQKNYVESSSPRSIIRQRGLEFDHFRQYQTGDDASLIDWKASARADEILTRVYSEDISMNILLMVDVSDSMVYGTGEKAKIEFAFELAINLAYGSLSYGDRVGLIMYNDKLVQSVPYGSGIEQFSKISGTLMHTKDLGGGKNLQYALSMAHGLYRDTHLLIMITDFLGYGEKFFNDMNAALDLFDILGMMVYDKTDVVIDHNAFYFNVIDPFSGEQGYIHTRHFDEEYNELNKKRLEILNEFFKSANKDLWFFETTDKLDKKLPRLLEIRNSALR
jgi:hypothetical protein